MKKEEIQIGKIYIEVKPCDYTDQLEKVKVLSIHSYPEYNKAGKVTMKSYVFTKSCFGQWYPARNSTENFPKYLDGLIGWTSLRRFQRHFKLLN